MGWVVLLPGVEIPISDVVEDDDVAAAHDTTQAPRDGCLESNRR